MAVTIDCFDAIALTRFMQYGTGLFIVFASDSQFTICSRIVVDFLPRESMVNGAAVFTRGEDAVFK